MKKLSKRIAFGLASFILAAGIGIAAAQFIAEAPIKGGVHSNAFSPQWGDSQATIADSADMQCTVSATGGTMTLNVTGAYPGGHCTVAAGLKVPNATESGTVTGMALTLPQGWTATLDPASCGMAIPVGGTAYTVKFTVAMGADAPAGGSSTFIDGDGVQVAPQSTHPTLACSK